MWGGPLLSWVSDVKLCCFSADSQTGKKWKIFLPWAISENVPGKGIRLPGLGRTTLQSSGTSLHKHKECTWNMLYIQCIEKITTRYTHKLCPHLSPVKFNKSPFLSNLHLCWSASLQITIPFPMLFLAFREPYCFLAWWMFLYKNPSSWQQKKL